MSRARALQARTSNRSLAASCVVVAACAILAAAGAAHAIIKVDLSASQLYGTSAQVIDCKVSKVSGQDIMVVVTTATASRKPAEPLATGRLLIKVQEPADLPKQVAADAPAVIFAGRKGGGVVHVADTWFKAEHPDPTTWTITGKYDNAVTFPGRTVALLKVLAQIRSGKELPKGANSISVAEMEKAGWPLKDWFEHSNYAGNPYDLGNVGVQNGTFIVSADVNADKKADLLVLSAAGAKLLLGAGPKVALNPAPGNWGLAGIAAKAAFGDVNADGKPDLLVDKLWVNTGTSFVASKAGISLAGKKLVAVALHDVTGDGKPDAVALSADGKLEVFENPGSPDKPWQARQPKTLWTGGDPVMDAHFGDWGDTGKLHVLVIRAGDITRYALDDDGGPPAGIYRLTGWPLDELAKTGFAKTYFPIREFNASAAIDLNGGDGRVDIIIHKVEGGGRNRDRDIVLMNRGYGAMLFNNEGHVPFMGEKEFGASGKAKLVAMTAADMYGDGSWELLQLYGDGRLFQINSPPYAPGGAPAGE